MAASVNAANEDVVRHALREKDDTFDYSKQLFKAMFKDRNDVVGITRLPRSKTSCKKRASCLDARF